MKKLLLFLGLVFIYTGLMGQSQTCVLKGLVDGRNSEALVLFKATDDQRVTSPRAIIPISSDGRFEYAFDFEHQEGYELIFKEEYDEAAWQANRFLAEADTLQFILHDPDRFRENTLVGGPANEVLANYEQARKEKFYEPYVKLGGKMNQLMDADQFYSPERNALMDQWKAADAEDKGGWLRQVMQLEKGHNDKTPKAKVLSIQMDSLELEMTQYEMDFILQNPSTATFYLLYKQLVHDQNKVNPYLAQRAYEALKKLFPNHPYVAYAGDALNGLTSIRTGGRFVDFEAVDLEGNVREFSEIIKGKVTVLDLWATWCGPCIRKSRQLIPLYEHYQNKGFTVVGVAREFNNTKRLLNTLAKEQFPWLQLVEINDQNRIWSKYNVSTSGGALFMIDRAGKIMAVNPTIEEIEALLQKL